MNYFIVLIIGLFLFSSCAKLEHLKELLTLKDYSKSQEQIEKYVQAQDQKFEELIKTVKDGRMTDYPTQKEVLKEFGEPIFIKEENAHNQVLEKWLYRYSTVIIGSEKVWLDFNESGQLVGWDHIPAENNVGDENE